MKATKIKDLPISGSGATRVLYKLDPPLDDITEYVVTSAVVAHSGPETYIFRADLRGNVTDWLELPGSFRGALDHQQAIDGLLNEHA